MKIQKQGKVIYKILTNMAHLKSALLAGGLAVLLLSVIIHIILHWWWLNIPGIIERPDEEYDYIVVGAGTAGSVLAGRLASDKRNWKVLVVEAGDTAPWISSVPLLSPALQKTSADWAYTTVPQRWSHFGMNNHESHWPRGKVLGGSSTINYLVNLWPSKADLDFWETLGCEGWNFEILKSYFIKSESYRKKHEEHNESRGKEGPLPVSEFDGSSSPLTQAFLEGATALGLTIGDLNGMFETGAMLCQSNILHGQRYSSFDVFLRPVMGSPNLHVVLNSIVTKVTFDGKQATGVEVIKPHSNEHFRVRARREVILCAGAIGSPHILLLSGVGPKQHLFARDIPLIADLPGVGRRLSDHLNVPMYFHLDSPVSLNTAKARTVQQVWKYFAKGEGYLSWSGVEAVVRTPLHGLNSSSSGPLNYILLFNMGSVNEDMFSKIANFKQEIFQASFPEAHNNSKEGFILLATCAQPKSEGYIELNSGNPSIPPKIDPRYLENKEDIKCFLKAMKTAARLGGSKALQKLGARLHLPKYETCGDYPQSLDNDDYLECWLRTGAITGYHPLGSCSMGGYHNIYAVLDPELRVRKVQNLRVVDASAIPSQISGTPHTLVIAMAEKAADMILFTKTKKENSNSS